MKPRVKYRDYKISKSNSTVCGYPGRDFDWSKFCWDGSEMHEGILKGDKDMKAPLPFVDNYLIAPNCEYLHVPFNWVEDGCIYRIRPNASMYAGQKYRGRLVQSVKAIQANDDWYWRLFVKA